ncbi:hypothetical protein STEG23_007495 [Scotinomys teguina]
MYSPVAEQVTDLGKIYCKMTKRFLFLYSSEFENTQGRPEKLSIDFSTSKYKVIKYEDRSGGKSTPSSEKGSIVQSMLVTFGHVLCTLLALKFMSSFSLIIDVGLLSWVMKLSPQQAPLYSYGDPASMVPQDRSLLMLQAAYRSLVTTIRKKTNANVSRELIGDCVVTILLAEEDKVEDDAIFYLIFSGSTLYHCTSTRKVSSDTLETIAPGHDCCETVKVQLWASKEGLPVFVVAEEDFHFVQDEAYDAAQFLATSAGNQQALNFTRFLDRSGPPSGDVNSLDEKVALAFRHLRLPAEWNVLGADHTLHDGGPRETLMHFAVRLGLLRLTWFLLQKPGGRGALSIHNKEGATPVSLALERGYHKLHQLLTEENAGEPDSWSSLSYEIPYGDCSVRHHRELDVYTLTSESESHREPHGDSCTGHIFKLMNIQQQLMKTNLKQMDNLMPLMVTAQGSSNVPSAPETDGQFLSCAPEPSDHQQLSSEETKSNLCCRGSPVRKAKRSCDLSSVAEEENVVFSPKTKDVERKGEEEEPASVVDSGSASHQDNFLQSIPDCALKATEGLPSCGNRNEVTGTKYSGVATGQQPPSIQGNVLQEIMVTEPGACQHSSGRELLDNSSKDAGAPENEGELEHSLLNPNATIQKNKHQVGEGPKEGFENSDVSTAEVSSVQTLHEPVKKASIANHVFATNALDANMTAESSPALSPGESLTEKTGKKTRERSCEERTDALSDQNSLVFPAATEDKISDGLAPDTPLAGLFETPSPLALSFSGPKPDGMPNQKSESNSWQALPCFTTGAGTSCAESSCQQNTVTSSGELFVKHCCGEVSLADSTITQPNTQDPCTALCPEDPQADTVTSDTVKNTQESVGGCPVCVLDAKSQGEDLKQDTTSTNMLEDVSHLPSVVPQTEKESMLDQVSPPGNSFSLASSPESESVTKDDALSLVPSQKEKGTTPQLHRVIAYRDGPDEDSNDSGKLGDGATGLSTPSVVELQPSMGNTSPISLGGDHESRGPTAAPEVLSDSSLQSVDKAALVSDSLLPEEGGSLVVPESSAALRQDNKDKAIECSSVKQDIHSSERSRENQRTPPPGQEMPRLCGAPMPAVCAGEKALQPNNLPGTPSAGLKTETKHNKEVALQVSPLTEGGAIKSLVPPKVSLAADSRQKASDIEQSSSSLLPTLLPEASEALHCNQPSALDVGVNTQFQEKTNACEVSRHVMEDVTVPNALSAITEPRSKDTAHYVKDGPVSELLNQKKKMTPSLPEALLDEGVPGSKEVITPEIVPLDCKREKLEGTDLSCAMSNSKEAPNDEETMQPLARDLPTDTGLSALNDNVLSADMKQVTQTSVQGEESNATSLLGIQAAHVPMGADPIKETATRIVEAVIKRVKASNTLLTKGEISNPSLPVPETKQLQNVCTESTCTFLPGETLQVEETTGNCVVEPEEPEKIVPPVDRPEPAPGLIAQ